MPPRRRPTACLLTPAGWLGAVALLAIAAALAVPMVRVHWAVGS